MRSSSTVSAPKSCSPYGSLSASKLSNAAIALRMAIWRLAPRPMIPRVITSMPPVSERRSSSLRARMRETSTISVIGLPVGCRRTFPSPEAGGPERLAWVFEGRGKRGGCERVTLRPHLGSSGGYWGQQRDIYRGQQCDIQAAPAHAWHPGVIAPAQHELVVLNRHDDRLPPAVFRALVGNHEIANLDDLP